ncbi:MAG: hypothetical protein IIW48_10690 [Clostridia bacterium]|nr:hypothetical protein [Clostridia bacterium]
MKLEGFEWSDELQEKVCELMELTGKNIDENEDAPSKHVLDGAAPLIHEITEMIKELPELKIEGAHKQEYIETDNPPELIYLDMLLKIADAPFRFLMIATVKLLIPIIDEKLQRRGKDESN